MINLTREEAQQPKALRLAEYLFESAQFHPQLSEDEQGGYASEFDMVLDEAAAELRRLHEVNAELMKALDKLARLGNHGNYGNSVGNKIAQEALAKATGEK